MKKGFILVEILISISIASMLLIVLFTSFNQMEKTNILLEQMMFADTRVCILQNVLENDISGIFAPDIEAIQAEEKKEEKPEKSGELPKKDKFIPEDKEKNAKVKKKPQTIENFFYEKKEGKAIKELSFITCNPFQVYNESKPRIVRVTYNFDSSLVNTETLSLFRQESKEIAYAAEKAAHRYEVVDGIKEIHFEYLYEEKERDEKENKAENSAQQKKLKLKKVDQVEHSENIVLPKFINVKAVFWVDKKKEVTNSFEFKLEVYGYQLFDEMQKLKQIKKPVHLKPVIKSKQEKQKELKEFKNEKK